MIGLHRISRHFCLSRFILWAAVALIATLTYWTIEKFSSVLETYAHVVVMIGLAIFGIMCAISYRDSLRAISHRRLMSGSDLD